MKKQYQKPQIVFEDFTLSTDIAGDCTTVNSLPEQNTCGMEMGPVTVFIQSAAGCMVKVADGDGTYNRVCYHVPTDSKRLFNS